MSGCKDLPGEPCHLVACHAKVGKGQGQREDQACLVQISCATQMVMVLLSPATRQAGFALPKHSSIPVKHSPKARQKKACILVP